MRHQIKEKEMKTRDFWAPTRAAAARMTQLGIYPERRETNGGLLFYGCELPDEFIVIRFGSPAEEARIGLASEPVGLVMAESARLAAERLAMRPGCGSPDGRTAHDDEIAIDAMIACGHSRTVYKGETMPWWHHEMFAPARAAAFRVACKITRE
jgi:hypothetical protein